MIWRRYSENIFLFRSVKNKFWKNILRNKNQICLLTTYKHTSFQIQLNSRLTEYPNSLHLRNILQEVHLLSSPDKNAFLDVTIAGLRHGKTHKYYLERSALPKMNEPYD